MTHDDNRGLGNFGIAKTAVSKDQLSRRIIIQTFHTRCSNCNCIRNAIIFVRSKTRWHSKLVLSARV